MLECTRLIEVVKKDIETNAKRIAAYEELVAQVRELLRMESLSLR